MRTLTAGDILQVWERAAQQPPVERALAMLGVACPELTPAQLAELDLGQRDARLWDLRALTFGTQLAAFAECPRCEQRLEFAFDVPALEPAASQPLLELATDAGTLQFRLPTSADLRAIADCGDLGQAQRALARRCLLPSCGLQSPDLQHGTPLPESIVFELAQHLQQHMPTAEITLAMECPACQHQWQSCLDVVSFLWGEIAAQARRLLREVHLLASAYGWREADILALSPVLRQAYLGMLS